MLSAAMKALIEANTIGCIATLTPDGRPAVSPKGTFMVVDDTTLAFSNIRSPNTISNLSAFPAVEVNFIDVLRRTGVRASGDANYAVMAEADAQLRHRFEDTWPDLFPIMHGIVTIEVQHAEFLRTPSYDVGHTEDELIDHWIKEYAGSVGYVATAR